MDSIILTFSFLFSIFYFLIFLIFTIKTNLVKNNFQSEMQNFSVIIAARNEEKNIAKTIESIISQNYPKDKFEIIVVNDRSIDETEKIVSNYNSVRLINIEKLPENVFGKKNALNVGINNSKFDIIVLTDADCIVKENWLSEISKLYDNETGVVVGFAPYEKAENLNNFLFKFINYEEIKSSLINFGMISFNSAILSSGRNFSYRKKVFFDVGGFEKINHSLSGDDDLFIQLVQQNTNWKIKFLSSIESYVLSKSPETFTDFVIQRIRHISASKFYSLKGKIIFGFLHLNSFLLFISFFISIKTALIILLIKFISDLLLINFGKLKTKISFFEILIFDQLLFFYYLIIGILSYTLKINWNRKF